MGTQTSHGDDNIHNDHKEEGPIRVIVKGEQLIDPHLKFFKAASLNGLNDASRLKVGVLHVVDMLSVT